MMCFKAMGNVVALKQVETSAVSEQCIFKGITLALLCSKAGTEEGWNHQDAL